MSAIVPSEKKLATKVTRNEKWPTQIRKPVSAAAQTRF